jgi:hypothetical protein
MPLWLPLALLAWVAIWTGLNYLLGRVSGWQLLARRFRAHQRPSGKTRSAGPFYTSIYLTKHGQYQNIMRLTADEDALYLSVILIFRTNHPPLRIPWSEITIAPARLWFSAKVMVTLGTEEKIPMYLSPTTAQKLSLTLPS